MSDSLVPHKSRDHRQRGIAALVCAIAMLAASPLPVAWQHWKYFRPIDAPAADSPRIAALALPQQVYAHAAPSLADLRVIDDTAAEVPYFLHSREQSAYFAPPFPATIMENSFSPGNYTQLVLDLAKYNRFHSSLRIETPENEFMQWVEIDASDDASVWRIVQEHAPIFRFLQEGHGGTDVVQYSPNNARYLRVRILDGSKRFPVTRVEIVATPPEKPEGEPFRVNFVSAKSTAPNQTAWSADLGGGNAPVREVRFEVGPEEFVREVTIQSSRDNAHWFVTDTGEIFRFTQGTHQCEELSVPMGARPGPYLSQPFVPDRYLRVEIANGNDKPLADVVPRAYIAAQHVVFQQRPGRTYRLLYGQSEAKPAQYDLRRRVNQIQINAAVAVSAGAEDENSAWTDPRAWTETHGFVVWFGVGFAVLLLAYTAIQSLRRSGATGHQ